MNSTPLSSRPTARVAARTAALGGTVVLTAAALVACGAESAQQAEGGSGAADSAVAGQTLTGEGASSQQNAMDHFGTVFAADTGAALSYTASGSGAGVTAFTDGLVDFAGSDSALKDDQTGPAAERCGGNEAWHLPMVIGPVAIAYNIAGVDTLNLSVDTIAKIFAGDITTWNDPAIAAENEGVDLPDTKISVIYRSDESGTSDNFQKFLAASTGNWDGEGKQFPQNVGAGANGSSGVATEVSNIDGAITYVESGFAKDLNLGIANVDFGNGPVELNKDTVGVALDNLAFKTEGHNMVVDSDKLFASDAAGSYPLVLTVYSIVCSAGYDEETRDLVKAFFTSVLDHQDADLESRGYIPVAGAHLDRLKSAVEAIS